jgi:hypothetical protein
MRRLQEVYSDAIRNTRASASGSFYEIHHRIIRRYSEAYGIPFANACIVFAKLSPRTSISLNLKAFILLIDGREKPQAVLTANWKTACTALTLSEKEAYDYLYSQSLTKVRAFARNLLLDDSVITLDAIMCRILKDYYPIPNLNHLFQHYSDWHSRIYPAIRELDASIPSYRIQATLWDYARRLYAPIPKNASLIPKTRILDSTETLRIGV